MFRKYRKTIVSVLVILVGVGLWVGHSFREAARRDRSENNAKQIVLALCNYEQQNRRFPPAYTADKDGKPLLSWRVLILPCLGEDNLYQQFHLDEPWDSEHNKQLIDKMPEAYQSPKSALAGQFRSNYLSVRGENAVFPGKEGIAVADITDGTSNTIMVVEVPDTAAAIWTKPDDFPYDPENPKKGLFGLWPDLVVAGMADGGVHFFSSKIDAKMLNALITRNGGEGVSVYEDDGGWRQVELD